MDEEEAAGRVQRIEDRRRCVEVAERVCTHRSAGEAGARQARRKWADPPSGGGRDLERALLPGLLELVALRSAEQLEPERRLQRDDGDVDAGAVEQREPHVEVVPAKLGGVRAFGELQRVAVEVRGRRSAGERIHERRRPEVLVHVDDRHR